MNLLHMQHILYPGSGITEVVSGDHTPHPVAESLHANCTLVLHVYNIFHVFQLLFNYFIISPFNYKTSSSVACMHTRFQWAAGCTRFLSQRDLEYKEKGRRVKPCVVLHVHANPLWTTNSTPHSWNSQINAVGFVDNGHCSMQLPFNNSQPPYPKVAPTHICLD